MGRPPTGDRAMTDAERQRSRRDRLRKADGVSQKPPTAAGKSATVAPTDAEMIEARAEIERLRQRVAELEKAGPRPLPRTAEEWAARRLAAEEAEKAKRSALRAARAATAPKLSAEDERTMQEKLEAAEKQLKAARTRIKNLVATVNRFPNRPYYIPKRLHRQVLSFLHPDRAHDDDAMRKKLERCFKEFNAIEFMFIDDEQTAL